MEILQSDYTFIFLLSLLDYFVILQVLALFYTNKKLEPFPLSDKSIQVIGGE